MRVFVKLFGSDISSKRAALLLEKTRDKQIRFSRILCDDDAFVLHDSDEGIIARRGSFSRKHFHELELWEKSLLVVAYVVVVILRNDDDDEYAGKDDEQKSRLGIIKSQFVVVKISIFNGIEFGEECNHEAVVFRATAKSCRSPGRSRERWDAQIPESHRAGVVARVGLYRDVLVRADWNFVSGVERTGLFRRAYYWADNSRWWRDDSGFCPRRRPESVLDGGARVRVFSAGDWRRDVFRVGVREETF